MGAFHLLLNPWLSLILIRYEYKNYQVLGFFFANTNYLHIRIIFIKIISFILHDQQIEKDMAVQRRHGG